MAWTAQILLSQGENYIRHIYATTEGDSAEDALAGADFIKTLFTRDYETWMRVEPEVASETDFDTKITRHRGLVRFSIGYCDGPYHKPKAAVIASIGDA